MLRSLQFILQVMRRHLKDLIRTLVIRFALRPRRRIREEQNGTWGDWLEDCYSHAGG